MKGVPTHPRHIFSTSATTPRHVFEACVAKRIVIGIWKLFVGFGGFRPYFRRFDDWAKGKSHGEILVSFFWEEIG
jgi:hypothetical protein